MKQIDKDKREEEVQVSPAGNGKHDEDLSLLPLVAGVIVGIIVAGAIILALT